jgi:peptidoglycan hydrolase-like protein with peptidoglycan-binding domain
MAKRSVPRRYLGAFIVLALVFTMVPLLFSGRAQADAYYPPGCWQTAVSATSWSLLCTCGTNGSSFVRDANYVTGIQREINKLEGTYPGWVTCGTQDGIFGSQTEAGVIAFQAYFMPRRWDGIVGPETWGWLRQLLVYRVVC